MLTETQVRLEIFSPDLQTPTTDPLDITITDSDIEFGVTFFGSDGVGQTPSAALIDIVGSQIHYDILDGGGQFLDVDDDTGFNGYQLTFDELSGNRSVRLNAADIVGPRNKIQIDDTNVTYDRDSVRIDVDGATYTRGDDLTIQLGFKIKGTGNEDYLTGDDGRDVLRGRKGADMLFGEDGRDRLIGNAGADTLNGGQGDDILKGGRGADSFVLVAGGGQDTIKGFDNGQDVMLVRTSASSMDDLDVVQIGNDLLIESDGAAFLLTRFKEARLDASDFDFG